MAVAAWGSSNSTGALFEKGFITTRTGALIVRWIWIVSSMVLSPGFSHGVGRVSHVSGLSLKMTRQFASNVSASDEGKLGCALPQVQGSKIIRFFDYLNPCDYLPLQSPQKQAVSFGSLPVLTVIRSADSVSVRTISSSLGAMAAIAAAYNRLLVISKPQPSKTGDAAMARPAQTGPK